jgi:hypothetical protein
MTKIRDYLYTMSWNTNNSIRLGEYNVPLPDMPEEKYMVNYGKKTKDQFFERTIIPADFNRWQASDQYKFIANEWHKRINGEWVLINGHPTYFTGVNWTYVNYWQPEVGKHIIFKYHDTLFFYFWDMCVRDPYCLGMLIMKGRRAGDTEKSNFIGAEYATRVYNSHFGMHNFENNSTKDDFDRAWQGISRLPDFYKPTGYKKSNQIIFDNKEKNVKEVADDYFGYFDSQDENVRALNSIISYEDTVLGRYDGKKLNRYAIREFAKWTRINVYEHWKIVKLCFIDIENNVIGKAILESSVEDYKNSKFNPTVESLQVAKSLWEDSADDTKMSDGQTITGLYRFHRGYDMTGKTDDYGFPLWEDNRRYVINKLYDLKDNPKEQMSFRRKRPLSINDSLMYDGADAIFDQAKITEIQSQKQQGLDYNGIPRDSPEAFRYPLPIRGTLDWKNGERDTEVIFNENNSGDFVFTQHPAKPNNIHKNFNGDKIPGSPHLFRIGIDPIDHKKTSGQGNRKSKGSAAVFKMFNEIEEQNANNYTSTGNLVAPRMKSYQWCCTYLGRKENPEDFFEDMIKLCVYFGSPMLFETQKNSIRGYFKQRGYFNFMMTPPKEAATKTNKDVGVPSTELIIEQYITLLLTYFEKYRYCVHHPEIIEDWRTFENTQGSRGSHDLTVACGISLIATLKKYISEAPEEYDPVKMLIEAQQVQNTFQNDYFRAYKVK